MKKILETIDSIRGGEQLYIVGGWIRDALLKRKSRDLDLASAQDPKRLAGAAARALKGRVVVLDDANKVYRVVLKANPSLDYIDFSKLKGRTIGLDLAKRDFTIDSIALPLEGERVDILKTIDPFSGRKDLVRSVVRMTYPSAFRDDPLRLLRAYRLAAELDFEIEAGTLRKIRANAALITRPAPERVREELIRILSAPRSAKWIERLERDGLLDRILPEITPMKASARKFYFHPKGLWQHSLETLEGLEEIFSKLGELLPKESAKIEEYLKGNTGSGAPRGTLLKLVALLHDSAKPKTAKKVGKRMRFLGHDTLGAGLIAGTFKRLRMSKKETRAARNLVRQHMRPISLGQAAVLTARATLRLFRDTGEDLPMLLLLSLADCYSYRRLKLKKIVPLKKQLQVIRELFSRYYSDKAKMDGPRLVDGHVLMKALRLKPGPVIGKLLSAVTEAQLLGKVKTRAEALTLARKSLTRLKK
jgi:poly(A) polymerase